MDSAVIVAIITGVFTFGGVVVTVVIGNRSTSAKLKEQTDLTLYRISELEKKVEKHNNVIARTYKLEQDSAVFDEKFKVANQRLDDLENKI